MADPVAVTKTEPTRGEGVSQNLVVIGLVRVSGAYETRFAQTACEQMIRSAGWWAIQALSSGVSVPLPRTGWKVEAVGVDPRKELTCAQ